MCKARPRVSQSNLDFRANAAEVGVKPGQSQNYKPANTVWELVCRSELVPLPMSLCGSVVARVMISERTENK